MDKSIYLANFTLVKAPYLAGINIRDALLQNVMIMTIYCMFYFYSHRRSIYTFRHLDTCFTTITTMNRYSCTVDALKIIFFSFFFRNFSAFLALLTLFPVPPPLPLIQNATLICCVNVREIFADKRACWVTGVGGGTHSKINYKALNETIDARSQQFFENQLSMRSHTKSVCRIL